MHPWWTDQQRRDAQHVAENIHIGIATVYFAWRVGRNWVGVLRPVRVGRVDPAIQKEEKWDKGAKEEQGQSMEQRGRRA